MLLSKADRRWGANPQPFSSWGSNILTPLDGPPAAKYTNVISGCSLFGLSLAPLPRLWDWLACKSFLIPLKAWRSCLVCVRTCSVLLVSKSSSQPVCLCLSPPPWRISKIALNHVCRPWFHGLNMWHRFSSFTWCVCASPFEEPRNVSNQTSCFFSCRGVPASIWRVSTTTPSSRPSARWCRSSSLSCLRWRTCSTSSSL